MRKSTAFLLVLCLTALSLITVEVVHAQTIPTPSIPEFTVKYINSSYNLTRTDAYTGAMVTDRYINNTIRISIRNQPFNPTSANNTNLSLFYKVGLKGHYSSEWSYYPNAGPGYFSASSSDFTVLNFGFSSDNGSYASIQLQQNIPVGGQVDVQVEAAIGYLTTVPYYPPGDTLIPLGTTQVFSGETSAWSETQTINISSSPTPVPTPAESPTPPVTTPSPVITSTPAQVIVQSVPTWFYLAIVGLAAVIVVLLGVIARQRGRKQ